MYRYRSFPGELVLSISRLYFGPERALKPHLIPIVHLQISSLGIADVCLFILKQDIHFEWTKFKRKPSFLRSALLTRLHHHPPPRRVQSNPGASFLRERRWRETHVRGCIKSTRDLWTVLLLNVFVIGTRSPRCGNAWSWVSEWTCREIRRGASVSSSRCVLWWPHLAWNRIQISINVQKYP